MNEITFYGLWRAGAEYGTKKAASKGGWSVPYSVSNNGLSQHSNLNPVGCVGEYTGYINGWY